MALQGDNRCRTDWIIQRHGDDTKAGAPEVIVTDYGLVGEGQESQQVSSEVFMQRQNFCGVPNLGSGVSTPWTGTDETVSRAEWSDGLSVVGEAERERWSPPG